MSHVHQVTMHVSVDLGQEASRQFQTEGLHFTTDQREVCSQEKIGLNNTNLIALYYIHESYEKCT